MFLVTGDARTYYPEPESEPGYYSRDGAGAIQNFAGSASLSVTLDKRGLYRTAIPVGGCFPWLMEWIGWKESLEPGYGYGHWPWLEKSLRYFLRICN